MGALQEHGPMDQIVGTERVPLDVTQGAQDRATLPAQQHVNLLRGGAPAQRQIVREFVEEAAPHPVEIIVQEHAD